MIRRAGIGLVAVAVLAFCGAPTQAQIYVPHTTTHIDLVPHRGHYDAVPHTTTHYDAVPLPTYRSQFEMNHGLGYNTGFGSSYSYNMGSGNFYPQPWNGFNYSNPRPTYQHQYHHRGTHLDVVPHRGHYHVIPHTTHRHRF